MIKYMTVERLTRNRSKNGNKVYNLPFNLESIDDFKTAKLPEYKKLMLFAEQYILAKSIDEMLVQDNNNVSTFLVHLKNYAQESLSTLQRDISQETYNSYKSGVESLLRGFEIHDALLDMFTDYNLYPAEERLLPKEFWKPFLEISTSKHKQAQFIYPHALMLYPELKDDVVIFHVSSGSCSYKKQVPFTYTNKQLNYLLHFDWDQTNWIKLMGIIGSYCIDQVVPLKSNKSLPHFLKAMSLNSLSPYVNYNNVKPHLFAILRHGVSNIYKTPYVDTIMYYLHNLDYSDNVINALKNPVPTGRDIMQLNNVKELDFLKNMVLSRATEAAEDENQNADPDANEDDTNVEMDFNTDIGEDNTDNNDTGDLDMDDDFGFDDESSDGDLGDTSDDFGGDSSSGGDEPEQKQNNVEVPDDPYTLALRIVQSETFDDYIVRNATISIINAVLIDPPATLSAEDLKFLRIWVTQWINFYPIETTKALLSKLSVYLKTDSSNH